MVTDPWSQYPPPPVEIKQANIYDLYDVHEEIGTGAFGVVHRCVEKATGKVLAAKFVPTPGGEKVKETVRNEIRTLSSLRHPAIVSLQDAFEMEQELVMVYEFMSGGELFEKASSEQNRMSEEEARKYVRQICEALEHMHEMSYVHLDLKPENIMFSTKTSDRLKLIDFGLTTKLDPNQAVKVTTGTPEFAAPEVVSGREVSFYTDMWSVGVLAYILVSGLSPFGGADDKETVENVRHCDWMMEGQPEFEQISADAREFIRRLLVADPRQRMTVHQALAHPWLAERKRREELDRTQIPAQRFHAARNRVRSKYNAWPEPLVPLGRLSQFSSLRIYQPERYGIRETRFDPNDALPRFVLRPSDCEAREGQSAAFFCKVLSPVPVRLSWWKDGKELGSGDGNKCRKHHNANDYALALADLAMEDRGEYTVRAVNEFGQRECPAFLNVLSGGKRSPTSSNKLLIPEPAADAELPSAIKSSKEGKSPTLLQVPSPIDSMLPRARVSAHHQMEVPRVTDQLGPPIFSFSLRPRLIQKNHDCKLLCTVSANPKARIEWLKNGHPVDLGRVQTMFKSGVASLEIFNTKLEDAGLYTCLATNDIGQDETSATLSVETRHSTSGYQQMESVGQRIRTARRSVAEQRRGIRKSPPTSDMGNVQLMSGLVGERREKLVNRAQAGRRPTATSLAGSSERGSPEQDNGNGNG